jgi:predicted Zn finger-like uncharacterized protein
MLAKCNSCDKKFSVPDSAITEAGRLVQCGSCGNKWTQYPITEQSEKKINKLIPNRIKYPHNVSKIKKTTKKKNARNLYSKEYLKKKYGLSIADSSGHQNNKIKSGFSFYNHIVIFSVFIIALLGILNLAKDIIIKNYPATETYINYLYEVVKIIRLTIFQLLNKF